MTFELIMFLIDEALLFIAGVLAIKLIRDIKETFEVQE
jgi:hypothetical protein